FGNIHAHVKFGHLGAESSANVVGSPVFRWSAACSGNAIVDLHVAPVHFLTGALGMSKHVGPIGPSLDTTQDLHGHVRKRDAQVLRTFFALSRFPSRSRNAEFRIVERIDFGPLQVADLLGSASSAKEQHNCTSKIGDASYARTSPLAR